MEPIVWAEPAWTGTAYLWPGAINASRAFISLDAAGQQVAWESAPSVEIPVADGVPLVVTGVLSEDRLLAGFTLSVAETDAAIAEGVMFWRDGVRRIGTIAVWAQS